MAITPSTPWRYKHTLKINKEGIADEYTKRIRGLAPTDAPRQVPRRL
jgi:hypothetical protein